MKKQLMALLIVSVLISGVLGVSMSEETVKNRIKKIDQQIEEMNEEKASGFVLNLKRIMEYKENLENQLLQIARNKETTFNLVKHITKVIACKRLYPGGFSKTYNSAGNLIKCKAKKS